MEEDDVLICWAMRFDGYLYQEDTGFEPDVFSKRFFRTNSLEWAEPLDCLAAFFFLQRFLYKFGGEHLEKGSAECRLFRKLFLHTAKFDIPERYRGSNLWYPQWYRQWLAEGLPCAEAHLSLIEAIDRDTAYSDV
jgi:hypothetical protein